jgi:choline dehydrogenase
VVVHVAKPTGPRDPHPQTRDQGAKMVDYIIVGAGSAGCVLAERLSENPHTRVLLIEAGGADTKREIRIPLAWLKLFKSEVDWDYTTTAQAGLGGRRIYWPRGKTLGGCSSTNAMMAIPGHRADYDGWADLGNEGWSFEEFAPHFERVHEALAVEELRDPNPLTNAFIEAAMQAGIPRSRKLGPTDLEGVRLTPVTQRRGRRWSAADAYLRPALRRPNLTVTTSAQVTRVLFDGTRAVGIAYRHGAGEKIARCSREVILSGGAVNSPQLLLLSGVGPPGELARHRIEPVHELPGVGLNLHDHPVVTLLVKAVHPTTLYAAETAGNLARYMLFRRGMLTSNAGEAAAFIHSRPGLAAPDLELMFAPGLFQNEGLTPASAHGFTIMAIALQPQSVGSLRLRSADPLAKPEIDPGYVSDPAGNDLRVLSAGLELARRILSMPALTKLAGDEIAPGGESLQAHIRDTAHGLYHPVGTCRMGTDELAVVDDQLRVRGLDGLRVVDASVIPRIPRGHTNLPTMIVAEKAADLIRRTGISPHATTEAESPLTATSA